MQGRLSNLSSKVTADPISRLQQGADNTRYPDMAEPALIHPFLTQVVKLRNNGAIDIFTTTNQGIRVDSMTQTVNIVCDGEKEHLGYLRTWVQRDLEEWVGSNSLRVIGGTDTHEVEGNISITGHANLDIVIDGNINVKAGGNMNFEAANYYFK